MYLDDDDDHDEVDDDQENVSTVHDRLGLPPLREEEKIAVEPLRMLPSEVLELPFVPLRLMTSSGLALPSLREDETLLWNERFQHLVDMPLGGRLSVDEEWKRTTALRELCMVGFG